MCLAVPGRIVTIEGADPVLRTGKVDFAGISKNVNLSFVPEAQIGDFVLVHVGVAISTIDESEAGRVFEYLREMGDLAELDALEESEDAMPPAPSRADAAERGTPPGAVPPGTPAAPVR